MAPTRQRGQPTTCRYQTSSEERACKQRAYRSAVCNLKAFALAGKRWSTPQRERFMVVDLSPSGLHTRETTHKEHQNSGASTISTAGRTVQRVLRGSSPRGLKATAAGAWACCLDRQMTVPVLPAVSALSTRYASAVVPDVRKYRFWLILLRCWNAAGATAAPEAEPCLPAGSVAAIANPWGLRDVMTCCATHCRALSGAWE